MVRGTVAALLAVLVSGCATARLHREGLAAFKRGAYEDSIAMLEQAVKEDPSNLEYRLDLRARRELAVQQLIAAANATRAKGDLDGAAAIYRRVLALQPGDERAVRGLAGVDADRRHALRVAKAAQLADAKNLDAAELEVRAVLAEDPDYAPANELRARIDLARGPTSAVPRLRTQDDRPVTLQFRDTPTKMVFEALARQTGLNFVFDRDVKSEGKTTIFVNQVPVDQAVDLILAQNQLGREVLAENLVLIYPNTPAKQKDYRDEIVHTFYLSNATPKAAQSLLQTVLGTKTLFIDERSSTLVMRDTPEHVRMAERLMASLDVPEAEVIMEVEILEVTHSLAERLGINYPSSINVSAYSAAAAGAGGGVPLSSLGKMSKDSITISPLAVSIDLLKAVGDSNVLSTPRIRARNNEKARILVGDRLPVVTSGTSATVGGAFSTSNVQYVDVGLTLEVQPTIHASGNVAIKVALEVSSILKELNVPIGNGGTTVAYQIGTRNASTLLELKDGETQILAGLIQDNEQFTSSHIPGLGDIPVLGRLFGSRGKNHDKSEIVLAITPRIVRAQTRPPSEVTEFWYGSESQLRSAPFGSDPSGGQAPAGPGGVSFGAGSSVGSAPAAPAQRAPHAPPSRIDSAAGPPPPPDAAADARGPAADARPMVTIEGPETAKVGDDIGVSVKLASASALGRIRVQVGFDAAALQLISAEPGALAPPGEVPKVETRPGGVQLELAQSGAPLSGSGSLIDLRFRVAADRPAISISTQVVLIGEDGAAVAATQATPLKISLVK